MVKINEVGHFSTDFVETFSVEKNMRFASTWKGWAKYDNIQVATGVTETSLLSVVREGNRAFAYLTLDEDRFNGRERLVVTVDGRYLFETHNGINYYSSRRLVDGNIQIRQIIAGTAGQVIRVHRAPGFPGMATSGGVLLESYTIGADLF